MEELKAVWEKQHLFFCFVFSVERQIRKVYALL